MKSELEVSLVKEDLRVKSANWEYRAGLFFSFVILDVCFTYSFFFPNYCKTACVLWSLAHVQHTQCFIAGISLTIEKDTFYFIFFPFELLQCVPSPSTLFGKAFFFFMLDSLVENMWEFFCFHLCCQFDFLYWQSHILVKEILFLLTMMGYFSILLLFLVMKNRQKRWVEGSVIPLL